ncbi:succinyl-diaminopimelate desuccinylase [Wenzhouxiangella sediminis]|uniref:Succinyl-diaminopimelate desuccinylase n=1 Tax=Wenzhouxiangella sediminis TaxID=1792836 RepID=A0A3E1KA57_9GAMM|nr:succinyl-diaminopimelate desuccinylase [Wenzhouxiangella sediminis]RFF31193.1 succinyl-diaminopimelate desuccinylase [Wenzhouxiangella sediminis]
MATAPSQAERDAVLTLARELISRASVTPEDAGCQPLIADRLEAAGMAVESIDVEDVHNLLARHGSGSPHLMLVGHTDVVPPGPESNWASPPFEPEIRDGVLYGRGAADMKSSVAAFVLALEAFLEAHPDHPGTVSLLLTSDEEGPARHGVRAVVPELEKRGMMPDACLVGEPSSRDRLGDVIRIGRRGSIQGRLTIRGIQGHTAYADPRDNPVHRAGPLLAELGRLDFDDGDEFFPPTRLQVSNVRAGTGADNVTPGELEIWFNLRNNPNTRSDALESRIRHLIEDADPGDWALSWRVSGEPFGPASGPLPGVVETACRELLGIESKPDTGGGTSDGRFFGPLGIPVVELGPVNATIHQVDECIAVDELVLLPGLYRRIIEGMLKSGGASCASS